MIESNENCLFQLNVDKNGSQNYACVIDGKPSAFAVFSHTTFDKLVKKLGSPREYIFNGEMVCVPINGLEQISSFITINKKLEEFISVASSDYVIEYNETEYHFSNENSHWDVVSVDSRLYREYGTTLIAWQDGEDNVDELIITDDCMYLQRGKISKHIATGVVLAISIGIDTNDVSFTELLLKRPNCEPTFIVVQSSSINNKEFPNILFDAGIIVFDAKQLLLNIKDQQSHLMKLKAPSSHFLMANKLGWIKLNDGDLAYNTGKSIIAKGSSLVRSSNQVGLLNVSGTLGDWQKHIFNKAIANNPFVLGMACLALTPLLFQSMNNIQPITVSISGASGFGKTILLQVLSSMFSNGGQNINTLGVPPYMRHFNSTKAGLEASICKHDGLSMFSDELGSFNLSELNELIYSSSAGISKIAARGDSTLREEKTRSTLLFASGEVSARDSVVSNVNYKAGVSNRLFECDITTPIFQEAANAWFKSLQANCSMYYGSPVQSFIEYIVFNDAHQTVPTQFEKAETRIDKKHSYLDNLLNGQRRVIDVIKLAEVAGSMAIDAGIFPVNHDKVTDAIDLLVELAYKNHNKVFTALEHYVLNCIRNNRVGGKLRVDSNKFIFVEKYTDRLTSQEEVECILFLAEPFNNYFGKQSLSIRKELRELGVLNIPNGRLDSPRMSSKVSCYALRVSNPHVKKLAQKLGYLRQDGVPFTIDEE